MMRLGIGKYLLLVAVFITCGCASDTSSLERFTRIDVVTGGFTKHFKESIFRVTTHGLYSVELLFDEGDPKVGLNSLFLIVHNEHDRDVEGATVQVSSRYLGDGAITGWDHPVVTEKYSGLYRIEGLSLGKPGHWVVSVEIRKEGVEDSAAFDLPSVQATPVQKHHSE